MSEEDRTFEALGCALALIIGEHARVNRLIVLADQLRWRIHSLEKDDYATRSAWDEACATAGVTPADLKPHNDVFGKPEASTACQLLAFRAWLDEQPLGELVSLVENV